MRVSESTENLFFPLCTQFNEIRLLLVEHLRIVCFSFVCQFWASHSSGRMELYHFIIHAFHRKLFICFTISFERLKLPAVFFYLSHLLRHYLGRAEWLGYQKTQTTINPAKIERTPRTFLFAVGIISIFAYFCCE